MAADSGGDRWSGFLLKAGAQNKSWKRRFFVLAAGSLRYYKRELDPRSAALAEQDAGQVLLGAAGASGASGDQDEACCVFGIEQAGLVADASE